MELKELKEQLGPLKGPFFLAKLKYALNPSFQGKIQLIVLSDPQNLKEKRENVTQFMEELTRNDLFYRDEMGVNSGEKIQILRQINVEFLLTLEFGSLEPSKWSKLTKKLREIPTIYQKHQK